MATAGCSLRRDFTLLPGYLINYNNIETAEENHGINLPRCDKAVQSKLQNAPLLVTSSYGVTPLILLWRQKNEKPRSQHSELYFIAGI
ncbi:hypothetical protein AB833_19405 [Chromatiales bacterium (ex Bugula neritina AB1)]|nr:hypothetical protein AB833_19405 [Chromatiales bacterium (ex Bugula neritina AB1)]